MNLDILIDWSNPHHRDKVLKHLETLEDIAYWFSIKKYRRNRSREQNSYYFAVVVKILSDYFGYNTDEMHEILKLQFNSRKIEIKTEYFEVYDDSIFEFEKPAQYLEEKDINDMLISSNKLPLLPKYTVIDIDNWPKYGKFITITQTRNIPLTTTDKDTYEFSQYIESIRDWAAIEHNVYIPSPNEAGYEIKN